MIKFLYIIKEFILSISEWLGIKGYIITDSASLVKMSVAFTVGIYLTFLNIVDSYIWSPPQVALLFLALSVVRNLLESYILYKEHKQLAVFLNMGFWTELFGTWIILSMAHLLSQYDTWKVLSVDGLGIANGVFLSLGVYYFVSMMKTLNKGGFIPDNLFKRLLDKIKGSEDFIDKGPVNEDNKDVKTKNPKTE